MKACNRTTTLAMNNAKFCATDAEALELVTGGERGSSEDVPTLTIDELAKVAGGRIPIDPDHGMAPTTAHNLPTLRMNEPSLPKRCAASPRSIGGYNLWAWLADGTPVPLVTTRCVGNPQVPDLKLE